MKKGKIFIACIFAASMITVQSVNAQWTRVGSKTYVTNTGDSIGIGTTSPAYKVDIQSSGIVTMSLKSTTSNANILFDRKTATNNSTLTYRTNGVNNWQTGTIGNNNYILKNNSLNSVAMFSEYTTNNIGIGTSTPTSKLDVNGTTRVQSLALTGGGTRPVFADANGVLVAQTQSQLGSFNNSTSANFTGLAFPCDTLKSTLAVAGMPTSITSGGIKVTLNLTHSHMPNFRAYLRAPNGQRIGLVNGANVVDHFNTVTVLTNTVINDEGGPIASGVEPYTGTYAPAGSVAVTCLSSATLVNTFAQLGGGTINPNGNWTLEMETNWNGSANIGGVTSWSITFIAGTHAGGTSNYFPKWNNGTLTETSNIYDDGTQIGIGTTSPLAKLHIKTGAASANLFVDGSDATVRWLTKGSGASMDSADYQFSAHHGNFYIDRSVNNFSTNVNLGYFMEPTVYGFVLNGSALASGGNWVSSDARLKHNIQPLGNILDKINKLNPVTYEYNQNGDAAKMNLPGTNQIGLIAQELEQVFPEFVKTNNKDAEGKISQNGFKAVNYAGLVTVLIEGVKEQQKQIENMQAQNTALQNQLGEMKSCFESICNSSSLLDNEARSGQVADQDALYQNQPNPANTTTVISYSLAKGNSNAEIIIRDLNGSIIKSFSLAQSGKGQLIINADELTVGTYTYTLVVNTRTVDTKLMVITK